jgi:hypothetical protein
MSFRQIGDSSIITVSDHKGYSKLLNLVSGISISQPKKVRGKRFSVNVSDSRNSIFVEFTSAGDTTDFHRGLTDLCRRMEPHIEDDYQGFFFEEVQDM